MDETGRVPWSRLVFGPWPFVPLPILLFGMLAYANRSILIAGTSGETTLEYARIAVFLTLQGIIISTIALIPMVLVGGGRQTLRWSAPVDRVPTRTVYLATCAATAAIVGVAQVLSRYLAIDQITGQGVFQDIPTAFLSSFVLALLFAVAITNIVGYVAQRIRRQTRQLEDQVRQLERQQRLIVEADQRVRNEVAEALHDDVQGALLRATLRLTRIANESEVADQARAVKTVIGDLEALRGSGVRAISRRLAPALSTVGLAGALDDLAASYAGSLDVSIEIDAVAQRHLDSLPREHQLAAYRIVEQALLNTAAHASAQAARVTVTWDDGTCCVVVTDDGAGLAAPVQPGHGSAVIDAWMTIVGGTWTLEPADTGGARLRAEVPIT